MPIRIPGLMLLAIAAGVSWFGTQRAWAQALYKPAPLHIASGGSALDVVVESRILHFRNDDSSSSLEQRTQDLRALLDAYFTGHPREARYAFTFGRYAELNNRMAGAASCSSQWDARAGRARSGDSAAWLRRRLRADGAYREISTVFRDVGYRVEIAAMESIILCKPDEVDWTMAMRSCRTPISPRAKLPCGALLTFGIDKL